MPPRLGAGPGEGRGEAPEGGDRSAAVRGGGARQDGGQAFREGEDTSLSVRITTNIYISCILFLVSVYYIRCIYIYLVSVFARVFLFPFFVYVFLF